MICFCVVSVRAFRSRRHIQLTFFVALGQICGYVRRNVTNIIYIFFGRVPKQQMAGLKEIKEEGTAGNRIIQLILKATKQSSILPSQYIVIAEGKQSRLSFIRKTLPLHQNLLRVQELGQACPYPHSPQKNQSYLSVSMKLFLMEEERFLDSAEKEISINAVNSAGDNLQKKTLPGSHFGD